MPSIDDIINRQFHQWEMQKVDWPEDDDTPQPPMEIVTVSRENGSRGAYFAGLLAEKLGYQLVHKEIVDAICASSGFRKRIVESLDDHYRSRLDLMVNAFVTGQAFDHSDYIRYLVSVVLSMARLGGVVLVGRGGNFILGPEKGFHIRCVCPKEERVINLMTYRGLSDEEARRTIERSDTERRALMRKVFDADIDDPHHYDMILNTKYFDIEDAVGPVVAAIEFKFKRLAHAEEEE